MFPGTLVFSRLGKVVGKSLLLFNWTRPVLQWGFFCVEGETVVEGE